MTEIRQIRSSTDELPSNVEAEQAVLGALLLDNALLDRVADRLTERSFYEPLHARIYRLISERVADGGLASPVTLRAPLEHDPRIEALGGVRYLARLAGVACPSVAVADYAEVLAEAEARRDLLRATAEATELLWQGEQAPATVAAQIEARAGKVLSSVAGKRLVQSHLSTVLEAVQWITNAVTGDEVTGVSTGLPQLDEAVGKLRPGELVLLGGRPGSGKTSIAQNIAFNAASAGVGVFFASLEMLQADIGVRFLARGLADRGVRIPYSRMLAGRLSEDEHRAFVEEAKRQQGLPLMMAERNVRATSVLRAAVRRARQAMADGPNPLGLVVVDYLQLLQPDQGGGTYDRVSAASDACKDLAMELGVPVLALAQLSRTVEHRDPPVPQMSDLRDSGRLEEDAGTVIFAYRCMGIDEIAALPVAHLARGDCLLWLWATNPMLRQGLEILNAWAEDANRSDVETEAGE